MEYKNDRKKVAMLFCPLISSVFQKCIASLIIQTTLHNTLYYGFVKEESTLPIVSRYEKNSLHLLGIVDVN